MELPLDAPLARHRLTVGQYHRMAEVGILEPDARVELIDGEILDKARIGPLHWSRVNWLHALLSAAIGKRALVSPQSSIRLGDYSEPEPEPEPDIAIVKPRDDYYEAVGLPIASDVLLLIEVSDATLNHDLRTKARLYARHGVSHYWVVDLEGGRLHQHRLPVGEAYSEVVASLEPGITAVPGLDGVSVDLSALFPKR